ncbi:MAG: DHH family phosphoesterase [Candidatus Dojkabacteria bacterium]|nr:MAG: DHH family phosphoesterase [Candidatus Dojkabacteria bacterium]
MNNTPQEIWDRISKANKILQVHDKRFDFDALCSALLMKSVIERKLGKSVDIIYTGELAYNAKDIVDVSPVKENTDISSVDLGKYDLVIVTDCGEEGHMSSEIGFELTSDIDLINIDHHSGNSFYGILNYVKQYGSACTVLVELFMHLDIELTEPEKTLVATGIVTDTSFMSFDTTTAEDLRYLADLLENGLDYKGIIQKLKIGRSWDDLMLNKIVLSHLVLDEGGEYAYSYFTLEELANEKIDLGKVIVRHVDNFKSLSGVKFVFCVAEEGEGKFAVSFRASDLKFSVLELGQAFGGGGREAAAAGVIQAKDITEAIELVRSKLRELNV